MAARRIALDPGKVLVPAAFQQRAAASRDSEVAEVLDKKYRYFPDRTENPTIALMRSKSDPQLIINSLLSLFKIKTSFKDLAQPELETIRKRYCALYQFAHQEESVWQAFKVLKGDDHLKFDFKQIPVPKVDPVLAVIDIRLSPMVMAELTAAHGHLQSASAANSSSKDEAASVALVHRLSAVQLEPQSPEVTVGIQLLESLIQSKVSLFQSPDIQPAVDLLIEVATNAHTSINPRGRITREDLNALAFNILTGFLEDKPFLIPSLGMADEILNRLLSSGPAVDTRHSSYFLEDLAEINEFAAMGGDLSFQSHQEAPDVDFSPSRPPSGGTPPRLTLNERLKDVYGVRLLSHGDFNAVSELIAMVIRNDRTLYTADTIISHVSTLMKGCSNLSNLEQIDRLAITQMVSNKLCLQSDSDEDV